MYEFHYKYIRTKYDNYANLLFTDTDSLVYDIETDNVREHFYENKSLFDLSDSAQNSKFFDPVKKKLLIK